MAFISPEQAGGANVVAFLDMLAWSEGTDNGKQPTADHGYDVLVGGGLFRSYADHPRVLVDLPKLGIKSTAAGRYQLLQRYYVAYSKSLGLTDFSPLSQDRIALQQIKERGALKLIQAGSIRSAIAKVSNIWASLPGAGYGQHEHKLDDLLAAYKRAGGTVAGG
ncbi:muramidase (phage lysozyme) [Xanthomonas translucens]